MKHVSLIAFLFVLNTSLPLRAQVDDAVLSAESARIETIERIAPTVLAVFGPQGQGGGSGVVISPDGYALSNFHVTSACGDAMKCGMADGTLYDAVIVGIDPTGDVALLKLFGRDDFPAATLGDSDQVRAGDWALVLGNPFLLATDFRPTVTFGLVSGVHRYQYPAGTILEYADCIQTDASINPGNSGGPLFDIEGRLIGINGRGSFEKRGRVNVGVGYAISINQIKHFLGDLRSGRIVDHATLGAVVASDTTGRVVVTDILESSDAYRRGLRFGDEIVSFAGRPIVSVNALKNATGIFPAGWRVPLSYRRRGEKFDTLVRLESVHHGPELWRLAGQEVPVPGDIPPDEQPPGDDMPLPSPHGSTTTDRAKVVEEHFVARRGYANYYYNQLERDRVIDAITAGGSFASRSGTWTIAGQFQGGGQVTIGLDDALATAEFPAGISSLLSIDDLSTSLDPPGSGGLLPALYLWRALLVGGAEPFDEIYYWGRAPLPQRQDLADVVRAEHAGVRCDFYCDPDNSRLLAVELWVDDEADPCELYFSEYVEVQGHFLPSRVEVRHGDELFALFQFENYTWEPASE